MSAGAVLLAGALYFVTAPADHPRVSLDIVDSSSEPPAVEEAPTTEQPVDVEPPSGEPPSVDVTGVDRAATSIVVLNNSNVSGLAARTAVTLQTLGWDVEDSANWVGAAQESSVVFYPAGLEQEATALAADLGVDRVEPMPETMPENRVTVVLTSE